ncbi:hypothetical protein ACOSOI_001848 [Campylobacter upsaliensis]
MESEFKAKNDGVGFRFFASNAGRFRNSSQGCERYRLRSYFSKNRIFAVKVGLR